MTRRCSTWIAALSATTCLAGTATSPSSVQAQTAPSAQQPTRDTPRDNWPVDRRLLLVGAGAIAGAVAFNVLAAPLGTVPFAGGALAAVPYDIALGSRLLTATAAGGGALGATWLYDRWTGYQSDYRYILTLGTGAIVGVAVGNLFTLGTVGTLPYYVGAGTAQAAGALASSSAQAASRVYVIGSAVLGTWVADYLYRR